MKTSKLSKLREALSNEVITNGKSIVGGNVVIGKALHEGRALVVGKALPEGRAIVIATALHEG